MISPQFGSVFCFPQRMCSPDTSDDVTPLWKLQLLPRWENNRKKNTKTLIAACNKGQEKPVSSNYPALSASAALLLRVHKVKGQMDFQKCLRESGTEISMILMVIITY